MRLDLGTPCNPLSFFYVKRHCFWRIQAQADSIPDHFRRFYVVTDPLALRDGAHKFHGKFD
jgi:hypothetical protein